MREGSREDKEAAGNGARGDMMTEKLAPDNDQIRHSAFYTGVEVGFFIGVFASLIIGSSLKLLGVI